MLISLLLGIEHGWAKVSYWSYFFQYECLLYCLFGLGNLNKKIALAMLQSTDLEYTKKAEGVELEIDSWFDMTTKT